MWIEESIQYMPRLVADSIDFYFRPKRYFRYRGLRNSPTLRHSFAAFCAICTLFSFITYVAFSGSSVWLHSGNYTPRTVIINGHVKKNASPRLAHIESVWTSAFGSYFSLGTATEYRLSSPWPLPRPNMCAYFFVLGEDVEWITNPKSKWGPSFTKLHATKVLGSDSAESRDRSWRDFLSRQCTSYVYGMAYPDAYIIGYSKDVSTIVNSFIRLPWQDRIEFDPALVQLNFSLISVSISGLDPNAVPRPIYVLFWLSCVIGAAVAISVCYTERNGSILIRARQGVHTSIVVLLIPSLFALGVTVIQVIIGGTRCSSGLEAGGRMHFDFCTSTWLTSYSSIALAIFIVIALIRLAMRVCRDGGSILAVALRAISFVALTLVIWNIILPLPDTMMFLHSHLIGDLI